MLVKLFRLSVLVQDRPAVTVENGEDDCVATATQRRRFYVLAITRSYARRVFHRQRNQLIIGTVGDISGIDFELARECCWRPQSFFGNAVADGAGRKASMI